MVIKIYLAGCVIFLYYFFHRETIEEMFVIQEFYHVFVDRVTEKQKFIWYPKSSSQCFLIRPVSFVT